MKSSPVTVKTAQSKVTQLEQDDDFFTDFREIFILF